MLGRSRMGVLLAGAIGLFLLLPLVAVVPFSFTAKRFLSLPDGDYSLRHYRALLDADTWLASIGTSALIAILSSIVATLLATAFALGVWLLRPRLAKVLTGLVLLPIIVPPVTSAVSIYFLLAQIGLLDTIAGVIIGHVVVTVPFAVVAIMTALNRMDRTLDQAARILGADPFQSIFLVILPNIRFGLFTAWFISLVMSWEESSVTLFISGVNVTTLPKRMWDNLRLDLDPAIAAISVLMTVMTALVIILRGRRQQSEAQA
ncbi:putative 2-aminoethylphosphonate transport system permease protein PhnU [Ensifer adhaerens]|uniref:ABC transporter permease n=1 Tax=Ensifer adhaerens TaxID=106592 RepID=UPI001569DBF9|nr:ABC transporter permease [Ensifer adhaerens]NRP21419.1 putative 2-aminoethylphosphonate transport system permease protein PhnU [Ensifer adhaerens]